MKKIALLLACMAAAASLQAQIKVSELPAASSASTSDTSIIVQGGVTKKATLLQILNSGSGIYQPLDSDLTSIAALTTTSSGRSVLTASALTAAGLGLTNGSTIDAWGAISTASKLNASGGTATNLTLAGITTNIATIPLTFSNTNITISGSNQVIWQTGTLSTGRTLTLPLANTVPAGTPITISDTGKGITSSNTLTVAASGSNTLILSRNGANETPTSTVMNSPGQVQTFISDGSNTWRSDDTATFRQIMIPTAADGNPGTGIWFGRQDFGTAITSDASQNKLRITARKHIDLLMGNDGSGACFVQVGNNGGDASVMFLSQEGTARAARVNIPSHRLGFNTAWWSGTAEVARTSVINANTDSSGNPYMSFYPLGSLASGTIAGDGFYNFSGGTETFRITTTGNLSQDGALSTPAYSFLNATSTGMYLGAGSNLIFARSGVAQMEVQSSQVLFNTSVTTTATVISPTVRVNYAGTAAIPNLFNSSDDNSGIAFPTGDVVLISAGGSERARANTTGFQITGTGGTMMIVGGTSAAPSNTTTPAAWTTVTVSGTSYRLPLYQ